MPSGSHHEPSLSIIPGLWTAGPDPPRPHRRRLWRKGENSVWSIPCTKTDEPDVVHWLTNDCVTIEVRHGQAFRRIKGSRVGYFQDNHYNIFPRVVWRGRGGSNPDVIVFAPGSFVDISPGEIFVAKFDQPNWLQLIETDQDEEFKVRTVKGAPSFKIVLHYFQTGYGELPLRWDGSRMGVDFAKLRVRRFSSTDIARREADITKDLNWQAPFAISHGVTANALIDLILAGQAHRAQAMLYRRWPKDQAGREKFWALLCRVLVDHPFWTTMQLARLPDAAFIERSARRPIPAPAR